MKDHLFSFQEDTPDAKSTQKEEMFLTFKCIVYSLVHKNQLWMLFTKYKTQITYVYLNIWIIECN